MNKLLRCVVVLAGASALASCESLREWAASVEPQPVGEGSPAVPVPAPAGGDVDLIEVATWVLAAMGLLPAARLVGASRPLLAPLLLMLLGKPKPKPKPAEPAPTDPAVPAQPAQ